MSDEYKRGQVDAFIIAANSAEFLIRESELVGDALEAVIVLREAMSAAAKMVEMRPDAART